MKLPPKFAQQHCTINQLHTKLAQIYHRDRAYRAAVYIQRWYRDIRYRRSKSRRYWLMLRGIFKFKYSLRKGRDFREKKLKEFEELIRVSATKIQKVFRGYV